MRKETSSPDTGVSQDPQNAGASPPSPIEEVVQFLAAERERAQAAERRLAVQQALLDERLLRVEKNRIFSIWNASVSRLNGLCHRFRLGSSASRQLQTLHENYKIWVANEHAELPDPQHVISNSRSWGIRLVVSIVMKAGDRAKEVATLGSIAAQLYTEWNVYVEPASEAAAREAAIPQARLGFFTRPSRDDSVTSCIAEISGEYIWFVEPGDLLSPYALYYMVEALQERAYPLVYADEDLHRSGTRIQPEFKPDWSPHLIASRMYIGRAFITATSHLRRFLSVSCLKSDFSWHDFLLHCAADGLPVQHVRRVLYHRNFQSHSVGLDQPHLVCQSSADSGRIGGGDVSIVICSRSPDVISTCLKSLNATAGAAVREIIVVAHEQAQPNTVLRRAIERAGAVSIPFSGRFNFSIMNNLAVERVSGRHVLFLNDDVMATQSGWLDCLLEQIEDKGAGIAGAVLWYPSGMLQHAGIVSGSGDGVVHIGRSIRSSTLWPWLLETRDVSAVTGACLCMPTHLFRSLGGFDTEFPNNYNDVDLCFRARAAGHRVVCVAAPGLIHAECTSRRGIVRFEERYLFFKKWHSILTRSDPYYTPNLAATEAIQLDLTGAAWDFKPLLRSPLF